MDMIRFFLAFLSVAVLSQSAAASEYVSFDSLDGKTHLRAVLRLPDAAPPHRAIVFLHGCSGMGMGGGMSAIYSTWARHMNRAGFAVLIVDSATPRGFTSTCGRRDASRVMYRHRPDDAYASLQFLQSRDDIRPDGIGLMGWSQGGGIVLLSIVEGSIGRPDPPPPSDFAAAVALYPAACSERLQSKPFTQIEPGNWSTHIPLLVLFGARDNWVDPHACKRFIEAAATRGHPVEIILYDNAVHSFDAPNVRLHERTGPRLADGSLPLIGTDPAARDHAMSVVPEFFNKRIPPD